MTSLYTNTVSAVLFCLFITSASSYSFIRQFTDDFNTNLQQENGAGPHKHQEISSRNYKLSDSNTVTGLRDHPPSSYSLKMKSFNTLLNSTNTERYESRPFPAAGYNWFYVFNRIQRKFFTIQAVRGWRFSLLTPMWGFSQVLPIDTFTDSRNGYIYDGDHCEFGVDVTIPSHFQQSELFSVTENFQNPSFTWTIRRFSRLLGGTYYSDVFSIGGRSWNIELHPSGKGMGEGKALSVHLILNANEKFRPYEKIYVRAKLRVLNQLQFDNVERQIDRWFNGPGYGDAFGWGYDEFMPLSDLKDSSLGFLVNDVLMVQVEMEAISSTKYFPN